MSWLLHTTMMPAFLAAMLGAWKLQTWVDRRRQPTTVVVLDIGPDTEATPEETSAVEDETMIEQLSFTDALEAKHEVLADMEEKHSGWMALALTKFQEVRHQLPDEFIGEHIRKALLDAHLPEPRSDKVWGPFVGHLAKKGMIEATGGMLQMRAEKSNARKSPSYRLIRSDLRSDIRSDVVDVGVAA